jgi:Protein kinase domain
MHPLADSGRVIAGRYRLETPIGRGAMGVVWRARDQLLDRDVAVKEVQIADTLTESERANAYQRTLREAKTAARLNHPGVVTVYDVAEDEGRPWIVMQLVSALSLDQVLATSGPLSARRTAEVGRQLLAALSAAHAAGVLHRDVKPSNVLLGQDDRAVLTDFGIATFQGDPRLTQTGMVMGSPGFTAPERIRGEDATPASDLWSLGATLFAAVEGHGPFEQRGGAVTTMSAIINEEAPPARAAGALGPAIAALLRREPAERPDAITAARMITDVLPLLPDRTGLEPAGYVPTALSASAPPAASPPGALAAPASAAGVASAGENTAADQFGALAAADTPVSGGAGWPPGPPSGTAPTKPQPAIGDAARPDEYQPTQFGPPDEYQPGQFGTPGGWGRSGSAAPVASSPPPDFSSWYDPAPRSGAAASGAAASGGAPSGAAVPAWPVAAAPGSAAPGSAAPGSAAPGSAAPGSAAVGSAASPGGRADYRPVASRGRRRPGLSWKLALALLVVLGAVVGAAVVLLVRHDTNGAALGSSSTPTLPPAATAPSIVNAVNEPVTGPLPAGWHTVTHQPTSTENAGFTIATPTDWTQSTSGDQTSLSDPSATQTNILIDLTPHTYPNSMLEEAKYIRRQSLLEGHFPGYSGLGLQAETIRGTHGAWWKFTWDDNGIRQEAIDLLFILQTKAGPQSYALYMTAPANTWVHMRPAFDEAAETFQPHT